MNTKLPPVFKIDCKPPIALLFGTTLLVSGCASLLPKGPPAPRLYTLNAAQSPLPEAAGNTQELPVTLRISKPQAAPGLESERIALRQSTNQMDYYADAKWAGDVATLLQAGLIERLESSHRFKAVSNDLVAVKSDYNVLIDIRDFQIDRKDGQTQAHVGFSAKLVDIATDTILQTLRYDEFVPVDGGTLSSVVAGFDTAQQHASDKLAGDLIVSLQSRSSSIPLPKAE